MTHDELLDKIYWHWRKDNRGDGLQPMIDYRSALLAVVELCNFLDKKGHCCVPVKEVIQAIEKELG